MPTEAELAAASVGSLLARLAGAGNTAELTMAIAARASITAQVSTNTFRFHGSSPKIIALVHL